jgi:hypothetical protein
MTQRREGLWRKPNHIGTIRKVSNPQAESWHKSMILPQ